MHLGPVFVFALSAVLPSVGTTQSEDYHRHHAVSGAAVSRPFAYDTTTGLPAGAADAQARLDASPRHGEWVVIPAGPSDTVRAWVVYPERKTKAPVVLVVHEIFGLSPWIRAVADQLAADGFIAIAPDLLTSKNIPGSPLNPNPDSARAAIRSLDRDVVHRQLSAVARYGTALPAANGRYGIVGFCWGGSESFWHAVYAPTLGASVVYYGSSPDTTRLTSVRAPVLGLYGENDARVNATVPPAQATMKALGKTFEAATFTRAGHGFLRAQTAQDGANLAATKEAWPRTVAWFRKYLEQ
jgi:carboxymethylenebutenolidase